MTALYGLLVIFSIEDVCDSMTSKSEFKNDTPQKEEENKSYAAISSSRPEQIVSSNESESDSSSSSGSKSTLSGDKSNSESGDEEKNAEIRFV